MPTLPGDALRALATSTVQSVAVASAALRKALATLVTTGGHPREAERRTR